MAVVEPHEQVSTSNSPDFAPSHVTNAIEDKQAVPRYLKIFG